MTQKPTNVKQPTSYAAVTHVTAGAYCYMNRIMNGFQGVTRAVTIAGRVVAESGPSMNTREKAICFRGKFLSESTRQVTL